MRAKAVPLPLLDSYRVNFSRGEILFSQSEQVEHLVIISSGFVVLCEEQQGSVGNTLIVNYVGEKEILGEQLLYTDRQLYRAYTAKAATDVTAIQLSLEDLRTIEQTHTALYIHLLKEAGRIAGKRLGRANQLIHCFKMENKAERLIHLILYFCDSFGRHTDRGTEVYLPSQIIQFYMKLPVQEFNDVITSLVEDEVFEKLPNDCYLLKSRMDLLRRLPKIVENLPLIPML